MQEVTAKEIKLALAKRHGNKEFFITECKNGPTGTGMLQFDGLAISKSWAHPCITGYEIKVSRSDFLRDIKYTNYMPYCHELSFVVPKGMIVKTEVEENIGLIWYNPENGMLTTKRRAIYRNIEISAELLLYVIMNRLDSDRLPFVKDKAEYWREWLNYQRSNKELGHYVKSRLLEEINKKEAELRALSFTADMKKELNDIANVIEKYGGCYYGDRAAELDRMLSSGYPQGINYIEENLKTALKHIEKIKKTKPSELTVNNITEENEA